LEVTFLSNIKIRVQDLICLHTYSILH